jgi:hypothetical protein
VHAFVKRFADLMWSVCFWLTLLWFVLCCLAMFVLMVPLIVVSLLPLAVARVSAGLLMQFGVSRGLVDISDGVIRS